MSLTGSTRVRPEMPQLSALVNALDHLYGPIAEFEHLERASKVSG